MKFSIRNSFFALIMLTSACYQTYASNIHIQNSASSQQQNIETMSVDETKESITGDQFEQLLQGVLEQIKRLGSILQSLADQISSNQIKLKNKQDVLHHIIYIKEQINSIEQQAEALVDHDITKISTILMVIEFFTEHIDTLTKNNLTIIPKLQTDVLTKRTLAHPNIESVSKAYLENETSLNRLETNINNIGLTAFNRSFRWLETFNDNYHITQRLWKATICGLAASTILVLLDEDLLKKIPGYKFIEPLKKGVGDAPQWNGDNQLSNEPNLGTLGKIMANFGPRGLSLISYVFTPILTWGVFGNYMKNDFEKTKDWADDAWIRLLNWLRGGAARKMMHGGKKEPSVTFKDGIGSEHIKYALCPYIEYYCRTEGWDRANIAPQTGIIFAGESRTGKTFMAEMLAGQIKQEMKARGINQELSFIVFNAAEVQIIGIASILAYARAQAPCVIFIDEIDMLGLQRETNAQVLSQFLTEMSGCMEKNVNKRVILIGATNKPESLDKALMQYGRFGKVIWFELPTMQERMLFLAHECTSRAILIDQAFLEKLARETERCSYDALHNIIATAAQKAKMNGSAVKQHHIEMAFDEEIRQMLVKNTQLPQHQQHIISVHLAGHALAAQLLDGQKKISKVTIHPVKTRVQEEPLWARFEKKKEKVDPTVYGKLFTYDKDQELAMPSHDDMIKECKITLAGHAAEKIILGSSGYSYHRDDHKEALSIAKYIVFKGINPEDLPKNIRRDLEEKAFNLMKQYEEEITDALVQKKEQLLMLAEALEKQQTLTGQEVTMLANLSHDEIMLLREEIKKLEQQLQAELQAEFEKQATATGH